MTQKRSAFNFDKTIKGFNVTERGVKSFTKTFQIGPFSQTINIKLDSGKIKGTTSIPGTGLAKRYELGDLGSLIDRIKSAAPTPDVVPDLPEYRRKPDMWSDDDDSQEQRSSS